MNFWEALFLSIIEGLTEFLPVSSTGHMIIASSFFGIAEDDFTKLFTIVIQLGAILSVMVLYLKKFMQSLIFYYKLFIAFIPAAFFGLLFNSQIDRLLENPLVVAVSLVLGGLVLVFIDRNFKEGPHTEPSYKSAFKIGLFQCLAMIPGVSRSAASIIGGMTQKLSRKAAAEFSFFLAVPTMLGATVKKTYDYFQNGFEITSEQTNFLILGNIVAFLVAMLAIKGFIGYLNKHGFKLFGYYRVFLGVLIIIIHYFIYPLTTF
jgi:undecaprenyl-diphosphatase